MLLNFHLGTKGSYVRFVSITLKTIVQACSTWNLWTERFILIIFTKKIGCGTVPPPLQQFPRFTNLFSTLTFPLFCWYPYCLPYPGLCRACPRLWFCLPCVCLLHVPMPATLVLVVLIIQWSGDTNIGSTLCFANVVHVVVIICSMVAKSDLAC